MSLPSIYDILVTFPSIIIGLTFHEFAHGWVAYRLGDPTAKRAGRLTLNPLAHVDALGFLMLFLVHFGWAKPVPVNPYNLNLGVKKGMLYVSLAGPVTNFLLAILSALLVRSGALAGIWGGALEAIFLYMVLINLVLAVFNLIPVPPLDGSKILAGILPGRQEWLESLENYGIVVLLVLIVTGIIGKIMAFAIFPLYNLLLGG